MLFTRKKSTTLLIVLFTFFANHSIAQYPGMQAVYRNINSQAQKMAMRMQMSGATMFGKTTVLDHAPVSMKYVFRVTMKDSTVKDVYSKIFTDTAKHKCYLYYIDKKLLKTDPSHAAHYIYPNQTICITRVFVNENNDSVKVYGAAMDSCWMFKTIKGRINAYSYLSEVGQDFDVYTIVGIQLGFDNPVQNFNDRNLQKMIADDRKAMKLLDDDDYYGAIEKFNDDN
jgi:hypothetical protein